MFLRAPAKINLALKILSRRPDGYHEISSDMRAIRLFDEVELETKGDGSFVSQASSKPKINVSTDDPSVPCGPENLAYKAAEAVIAEYIRKIPAPGRSGDLACCGAIDIKIRKNIPVAAGLGGGSADAAAVILGLAKEMAPEKSIGELAALGVKTGADVPFCVYSCAEANPALGYIGMKAALAEGIGDKLTPEKDPEKAWIVLVKTKIEINTADIYAKYDDLCAKARGNNDLEAPCISLYPKVGDIIGNLKDLCVNENADSAIVQLSGSGPTVFAYIGGNSFGKDAEATASRIYEKAKTIFTDCFICLTETL